MFLETKEKGFLAGPSVPSLELLLLPLLLASPAQVGRLASPLLVLLLLLLPSSPQVWRRTPPF